MTRKINYTTIPRNGLVAEYLLDGNALATVGANGTPTNVTWGTDGTIGYQKGYGIFNGSSSRILLPDSMKGGNNLTIVSFVKINELKNQQLYSEGHLVYAGITLMSTGALGLANKTTSTSYSLITSATNLIEVGKYYMITYRYNSSDGFLSGFIDGIRVIHQYRGGNQQYNNGGKNFIGTYDNISTFVNGNILSFRIYDRALLDEEITNLYLEGLRKLGPTNAILSGDFPLYSLPNLEQGKVLEISKPKVGSNYINQVDGSSYTATNVTDSTNGKYNVMSFTSGGITWSSLSFSTSVCYEKVSGKWEFKLNPTYITSTGVTSGTREIANIKCWNRVLSTTEIEQFKYGSKIV